VNDGDKVVNIVGKKGNNVAGTKHDEIDTNISDRVAVFLK
jgi:hypothetical protein